MKPIALVTGVFLALSLFLIACGGQEATPTPAAAAVIPIRSVTPASATYDYKSLIDDLRKHGATVEELSGPTAKLGQFEPGSSLSQVVLLTGGRRVAVDGLTIQVYEFPDYLAADTEAGYVSPNGYNIRVPGGIRISDYFFGSGPHYYKKGRVIVFHAGSSCSGLLEDVLGPQFAGTPIMSCK